jgi:hypothetical protein
MTNKIKENVYIYIHKNSHGQEQVFATMYIKPQVLLPAKQPRLLNIWNAIHNSTDLFTQTRTSDISQQLKFITQKKLVSFT